MPTSEIVRKPQTFTMAEAAAYPTVAVAAWRYLMQAADVQRANACSCRAERAARVR